MVGSVGSVLSRLDALVDMEINDVHSRETHLDT